MPPVLDRDWKFAFKIVIAALIIVSLGWLLIRMIPVITLFLIAILIVYAISPLMNFLIKKKVPSFLAAISTFSIILFSLGALFYLFFPGMIRELSQLIVYLSNDFMPTVLILLQHLQALDERFNLRLYLNLSEYVSTFLDQIPAHLQELLRNLSSFSWALVSRIWYLFVLAFVIFYLLLGFDSAKQQLTSLFPRVYHKEIGHILGIIDEKVGAYIRGTIVRCIIVGILTGTILYLTGMPFSLMLGVLAGLLNIIVYIGPVIAAVPALLLSLVPDTPHFLWILGVYIVVQLIDAFILTPFLLGKAVDLNPLTIIAVILISARLAGVLGIIIAIPVAAILKVLIHHYYLKNLNST